MPLRDALNTSPSSTAPAATAVACGEPARTVQHPRCVLERIRRIQAMEPPKRPPPARNGRRARPRRRRRPRPRRPRRGWSSVLSGGEAPTRRPQTSPEPSTSSKRKSSDAEAGSPGPAEKKPKPSPLRSRSQRRSCARASRGGPTPSAGCMTRTISCLARNATATSSRGARAAPAASRPVPPRAAPNCLAHPLRPGAQARDPELAEVTGRFPLRIVPPALPRSGWSPRPSTPSPRAPNLFPRVMPTPFVRVVAIFPVLCAV